MKQFRPKTAAKQEATAGQGRFSVLFFKKRILVLLLLVLIIVAGFLLLSRRQSQPPPEIVATAIANTFASDNFRFTTDSFVYVNGNQRQYAHLNGEKVGEARHISGDILGTPVNIYFYDEVLYQQNSLDGNWHSVFGGSLADASELLAEIEPARNFDYRELGETNYLGREEVDGVACWKLECPIHLADQWIENYFKDIVYLLWVEPGPQLLRKAQISATSKENAAVTLLIENCFSDFGAEILLNPPVIPAPMAEMPEEAEEAPAAE